MKIYTNNRALSSSSKPNFDDIPLCFINTFDNYKRFNIYNKKIDETIKRPIAPYESFNTLNIALFDELENKIDHSKVFERDGDTYYYMSSSMYEFVPTHFNAKITIKKNIETINNRIFNISAACDNIELARKLITIFGDANKRNIGLKHISINNNDTYEQSLINKSLDQLDLLFVESSDGLHYRNSKNEIDFKTIMDSNTNLWIGVDSFENLYKKEINEINLKTKNEKHKLANCNYSFNITRRYNIFDQEKYIYHDLFIEKEVPILIIEKPNKSFVILSHNSIFDNIYSNIDLFYSILEYIYFNSYKSLNLNNMWVSYYPIDFIANSKNKYNKCHPYINIQNLLTSNRIVLEKHEYLISNVITNNKNVIFSNMTDDGALFFKKQHKEINDVKDGDYVSFYSSNNTIIYYIPDVYIIETAVDIKMIEDENKRRFLEINKIKSTVNNININRVTLIDITNLDCSLTYSLICENNILKLININDFRHNSETVLCNIQFIKDTENKILDLRRLGGGLSTKEKDNYNLLDIGSINGRPYRKGNTLIITLPKQYEQYDSIIKSELYKHCLGEDFVIVLYE